MYYDYIHTPILEIKKGKEEPQNSLYQIYKEDISLKELDYRLRERAIKQHGLYSNGLKQGQITITMKDGKSHTIDLSQNLKKNVWVILSTADKYKNSSRNEIILSNSKSAMLNRACYGNIWKLSDVLLLSFF